MDKKEKIRLILGIILFAVFAAACLFGAMSYEFNIVLAKASNICLECIGIGK